MDLYFEISKDDENALRNSPKLPAVCHFLTLFKRHFKLPEVTPYDLEQSLLLPQYNSLVGEVVSRLISKRSLKKDSSTNDASQDYDRWNEVLAKKVSLMFKTYRRFCIQYLEKDPLNNQEQSHTVTHNSPMQEKEESK